MKAERVETARGPVPRNERCPAMLPMAGGGIGQFIDLGTGLPALPNVHAVAVPFRGLPQAPCHESLAKGYLQSYLCIYG